MWRGLDWERRKAWVATYENDGAHYQRQGKQQDGILGNTTKKYKDIFEPVLKSVPCISTGTQC